MSGALYTERRLGGGWDEDLPVAEPEPRRTTPCGPVAAYGACPRCQAVGPLHDVAWRDHYADEPWLRCYHCTQPS